MSEDKVKKQKTVKLNKKGRPKTHHLRVFFLCLLAALVVVTFGYIYLQPTLAINGFKRSIISGKATGSPVPVNTMATVPDIASPGTTTTVMTTGNQDTLYSGAWLDLRQGPLVLTVPDMGDRYYAIQFSNPKDGRASNYVGSRATGNKAGTYLLTGPGYSGDVPTGMTQVSMPNNQMLLLARVYVADEADVPAVRALSEQITLTPLGTQ